MTATSCLRPGCGVKLVIGENISQSAWDRGRRRCQSCLNAGGIEAQRRHAVKHKKAFSKTFIYVLLHPATDKVKVGIFKGLASKRLAAYQTGCPDRAYSFAYIREVHDYAAVEKRTHKLLSPFHHSHEWFACPIEQAIEAIQAASQ